jgi:nickel transport protein
MNRSTSTSPLKANHPPRLARMIGVCLLLGLAGHAFSHDAWLDPAPGGTGDFMVRFTDDKKPQPYPASKVTRVVSYNAAGQALALNPSTSGELSRVMAPADSAMLTLEFDNGFYSRTVRGTVNKPMNEVPGATAATWALKTGKYIKQWSPLAQKANGLRLEIVPQTSEQPKVGDVLTVQVLWEGKPLEGVKVSKGEHDEGVKTDASGKASYKVDAGQNFVWTERRAPFEGDARFNLLAVASNLVFNAR